jgi:hypothetical protein
MVAKALSRLIPLASIFPCLAASGQERAPLQANAAVQVNDHRAATTVSFSAPLEGGPATLTGSVSNLPGSDTALIALKFDYRTQTDFALDEIIGRIVIAIEDSDGNAFSISRINPNTIHLNPNRVPLYYSATLYTPEPTRRHQDYVVRVHVFGNYE